jgi:hypothetical protein
MSLHQGASQVLCFSAGFLDKVLCSSTAPEVPCSTQMMYNGSVGPAGHRCTAVHAIKPIVLYTHSSSTNQVYYQPDCRCTHPLMSKHLQRVPYNCPEATQLCSKSNHFPAVTQNRGKMQRTQSTGLTNSSQPAVTEHPPKHQPTSETGTALVLQVLPLSTGFS